MGLEKPIMVTFQNYNTARLAILRQFIKCTHAVSRLWGPVPCVTRAACVCMSTLQLFCIWCIKNGLDGRFFKGLENRKNWLSAESWRSWCTGRGPILYNDPRQLRHSFFTVCIWTLCTFGSGHHFFTLNSYTAETC